VARSNDYSASTVKRGV